MNVYFDFNIFIIQAVEYIYSKIEKSKQIYEFFFKMVYLTNSKS